MNETALREFLSATGGIAKRFSMTQEPSYPYGMVSSGAGSVVYDVSAQEIGYEYEDLQAMAYTVPNWNDFLAIFLSQPSEVQPLPGNAFAPSLSAAVTSNSGEKDTAKAFIQTLLSGEIQGGNYLNGLPVHRAALKEKQAAYAQDIASRIDQLGDPEMQERYKANIGLISSFDFDALLGQYTVSSAPDVTLQSKVYAEAARYYMGEASLDEAVANIAAATKLYFEEQKQ